MYPTVAAVRSSISVSALPHGSVLERHLTSPPTRSDRVCSRGRQRGGLYNVRIECGFGPRGLMTPLIERQLSRPRTGFRSAISEDRGDVRPNSAEGTVDGKIATRRGHCPHRLFLAAFPDGAMTAST